MPTIADKTHGPEVVGYTTLKGLIVCHSCTHRPSDDIILIAGGDDITHLEGRYCDKGCGRKWIYSYTGYLKDDGKIRGWHFPPALEVMHDAISD